MRRATTAAAGIAFSGLVAAKRELHFPISRPPIEIGYLDTDPLEFALRTEARVWGFDDFAYMRELAFVRINDNPTVGDFRNMSGEERKKLWWGCNRQDFYRWFVFRVCGKKEHLYHTGWDGSE